MRRSGPVLACSFALLSLAGCASAARPRVGGIPPRSTAEATPARKSGWLGGLASRLAATSPRTSGPTASESTLARYFPGLPRSNASGRTSPKGGAAIDTAAPLLATYPTPPRPSEPSIPADSPTLPISLDVAVFPAPASAPKPATAEVQVASRETPADPSPLIEADAESPQGRPEPEPIIQVKAETTGPLPVEEVRAQGPTSPPEPMAEPLTEEPVPLSEPAPIVEAGMEATAPLPEPAPTLKVDAQALVPSALDEEPQAPPPLAEPAAPVALPAVPSATVGPLALPSGPIEPSADPDPPAPVAIPVQDTGPLPEVVAEVPAPGPSAEVKPEEPAASSAGPPPLVEAPDEPAAPSAPAIPPGRPRLSRIAPVKAPTISRADRANLLFPRTYYEPEAFAEAPPAAEESQSPQARPARRPSLLRRWFNRPTATAPAERSARLEPGDVAQGR